MIVIFLRVPRDIPEKLNCVGLERVNAEEVSLFPTLSMREMLNLLVVLSPLHVKLNESNPLMFV